LRGEFPASRLPARPARPGACCPGRFPSPKRPARARQRGGSRHRSDRAGPCVPFMRGTPLDRPERAPRARAEGGERDGRGPQAGARPSGPGQDMPAPPVDGRHDGRQDALRPRSAASSRPRPPDAPEERRAPPRDPRLNRRRATPRRTPASGSARSRRRRRGRRSRTPAGGSAGDARRRASPPRRRPTPR
jgi:hypothetical protein